jgi:acetyl-CoA C-acetyltransferase
MGLSNVPCTKVECACAAGGIGSRHAVVAGQSGLCGSLFQLRGSHANEVRDAAIGLTHNLGGVGVACTVKILRRPDAR